MTQNNRERLISLYKDNGLTSDDIFKQKMGGKELVIITRSGIEKIAAKNNIYIEYDVIVGTPTYWALKANAYNANGVMATTFGSAGPDTSHNKYYAEMAEKRAMSRAVLKAMRLYELGVFGEDEADDFKRGNNSENMEV